MAQTNRILADIHRHGPSRAEIFETSADLRLAFDAGGDDGGRGGFPFRMLALSYGLGLVLAISMVGAGFGVLTAAIAAWLGGVAAMTVTPFIMVFLDDFMADVKARARTEAHRRATLEAWNRDSAAETAEARLHGMVKAR